MPATYRKADGNAQCSPAPRAAHRIVHLTTVHHALDPRIFHKQLRSLYKAGYDVHLVAPRQRSKIVEGIVIHALPQVEGRYRRALLQRHALHQARKLNADCYHIHDPELIPLAYALKHLTGAAIIYDIHEDYRWHGPVEGRLLRALERWCFRWVDHVILAESSYRPIVTGSGASSTFIGNYMRPYDEAAPPPRNEPGDPFRLLYAGIVGASRGLFHMIELLDRLRTTGMNAVLDVVGVCNFADQRQRAVHEIGQRDLGRYVRRKGWDAYVPAATMTPYYRGADVGLALFEPEPNYVQSMPTKFFEYLHYGLPILCSDFPAWRQFVEQHGCGAAVAPGDAEAALAVLRRWRHDPDRYREVSKAARAAAAHYRWEAMGKRLVRCYDELLNGCEAAR